MADPKHLEILQRSVEDWNRWRSMHETLMPDLTGADLNEADLSGANLTRANLARANLIEADLIEANLFVANLAGSNLRGASLTRANLAGSNLRGVNLGGTYMAGANLGEADLSGADLRGADLGAANLTRANLARANLTRASLDCATLIDTNLDGADLTGASIYGISAWDLSLQGAIQKNLIIQRDEEDTRITVDDLEVAQFIYLLLNRSKLRNVFNTLGEKAVLILGRFTERKDLLESMADKLRQRGYLPIIFDFERPTNLDFTETVNVLAGLSRFVIADITNPSSVQVEISAIVPDFMVPFVTIKQRGQPAFSMFHDFRKYSGALDLLEYDSPETLLATFETKVIGAANEKLEEVRQEKARIPARRSAED